MAIQALLPYAPAIGKGLMAGLGYAFRPKRRAITPRFGETAYGGLLGRRAREGTISPRVRGGLLGRYGRTIGGETQKWRSGVTGGLVSRGMYGSIAGLRALGEPERYRTGLLGGYAKELDIESEMGKQRAEEELARLSTQYEMQRRAEEEGIRMEGAQAKWGLLGGLGEAGMGIYGGLMGGKYAKDYPELAPYIRASQLGINLPYGFQTGLLRREQAVSDENFARVVGEINRLISEGKIEEAKQLRELLR